MAGGRSHAALARLLSKPKPSQGESHRKELHVHESRVLCGCIHIDGEHRQFEGEPSMLVKHGAASDVATHMPLQYQLLNNQQPDYFVGCFAFSQMGENLSLKLFRSSHGSVTEC